MVLTLGPLGAALCTLGAGGVTVVHMPVRVHPRNSRTCLSQGCQEVRGRARGRGRGVGVEVRVGVGVGCFHGACAC